MEADGHTITVMLADDHTVVRTGLRLLLDAQEGMTVVAEAGDVETALRKVAAYRPAVLVLDLQMPGESSLPTIPRIIELSPQTRIVVLTMQTDPVFAREAMAAGALGYVLKEAADRELVEAVRYAAADRTYVNPALGARLAREHLEHAPAALALTVREIEVLRLIARGHTNAEIAKRLVVSVRTVESHRAHIQRKTERATRAELVAFAREHGLLE
jgi:two-component system response regulator NreC